MDVLRCKHEVLFELHKKLKETKIYDKYLDLKFKNFKLNYEIPKDFRDTNYLLTTIRNLDEARKFVTADLFE